MFQLDAVGLVCPGDTSGGLLRGFYILPSSLHLAHYHQHLHLIQSCINRNDFILVNPFFSRSRSISIFVRTISAVT